MDQEDRTEQDRITTALRKPVLQALQDWFGTTYGVGTGILDENVRPLTFEANHQPYCRTIRRMTGGLQRCRKSDSALLDECKKADDVVWRVCDNGLLDLAVPIKDGDRMVAFLFAGQLRGRFGGLQTDGDLKQIENIVWQAGVSKDEASAHVTQLDRDFKGVPIRTPVELAEIDQAARRFGTLLSWVVTKAAQWAPDDERLADYLKESEHAEGVDDLLALSVNAFPRIIGAKACSIFLVGKDVEKGERLILRKTSYRKLKPQEDTGFYKPGQGLTGWVWKKGRSLRVRNVADKAELAAVDQDDPPRRSGHLKDCDQPRECLLVPIIDRTRNVVHGVVRTAAKSGGFTLDDEIALSTLGDYLYSHIELSERRERAAELKKVLDMALSLHRCGTKADLWRVLVKAAVGFFGEQEKAYLMNLIRPQTKDFTTEVIAGKIAASSLVNQRYDLAGTTTGWVVRRRRPILVHDLEKASKKNRYVRAVPEGRSIMAAPVCANESPVVGVLAVISAKRYAFTEGDVETLRQLCQCAGEALVHVENLATAADFDKLCLISNLLTGLRHDLGTPAEKVDVGIRKKTLADADLRLLSDFVLTAVDAYQFSPTVSPRSKSLGLEPALQWRVQTRRTKFEVRLLIERCVRVVDLAFIDRPTCRIRCPRELTVKADYGILSLVVYNLLKNAREHASRRKRNRLCISVIARREKEMVSLVVRDGNRPIPCAKQASLFVFKTEPRPDSNGRVRARLIAKRNRAPRVDLKALSKLRLGHEVGLPLARLFVEAHPGPRPNGRGTISYCRSNGRNVFTIRIRG